MSNYVEHAIYALRNAHVRKFPYPHFHVHDVFPWPFYDDLVAALPADDQYQPMQYKHRMVLTQQELVKELDSDYFAAHVLSMFGHAFFERYPHQQRPNFRHEIRFIRDEEGYAIGPHTDAPNKVVSLLFYLPKEYGFSQYGTGVYVPDDGKKTCKGGPHHKFEGFTEVWRAPFVPNSCFGFFKTDNSWHGVEEIGVKIQRDVMLFNIYEDAGGGQGNIPA